MSSRVSGFGRGCLRFWASAMRTHLLMTTAAVALLAARPAQAQDATWVGTTNSYTTPTNWNTNSVPTGTGFFGGTGNPSLSITTLDGTVGGWTLNSGAQNYTFNNESPSTFSFTGAGIIINGGSATITNNAVNAFPESVCSVVRPLAPGISKTFLSKNLCRFC